MIKFCIGQDTIPKILQDRIMVCRTWDDRICYEYHGDQQDLTMQDGDILVVDRDRIYVTKNKQEHHQEQQNLA